MSEPFIAEIRMFTYAYAPAGWAYCDGQRMPIAQNTALFALLGTTYGGDGRYDFGIPNLMGRAPMHPGRGPGLSAYRLGQYGGSLGVELTEAQMPNHEHSLTVSMEAPESDNPTGLFPSRHEDDQLRAKLYRDQPTLPLNAQFASAAVGIAGASLLHENRQPFLTLSFCIALQGLFPPRS